MTTVSRLSFTPSNILYAWLLPTLVRGGKQPLQLTDIEPLQDTLRADQNSRELAAILEAPNTCIDDSNSTDGTASDKPSPNHSRQQQHQQTPSIYSIVWRLHYKPMIPALILFLITAVTSALLPLLIRAVVRFAQSSYRASHNTAPPAASPQPVTGATNATQHSVWYGYGLIIAYAAALMCVSLFDEYASLICLSIGQKLRVQLASQMLSKIMRISSQCRSKLSMGSLINLVGSDSVILMLGFGHVPNLTMSLVQMLISFILLIVFLGPPALVGCAILLFYYPLQQFIAVRIYRLRKQLSAVTDERVRLIREVIQGIRVVKCFTMETAMLERVAVLRRRELKLLRSIWIVQACVGTLLPLLTVMAGILAIATYAA
ncbi:hypothetical protein GQ42DRAFT_159327, partial [Ramicandelaber brevisporus]